MVPFFTENGLPQARHFQIDRVLRKPTRSEPHSTHRTPSGQRKPARKSRQTASSSK
jgi:hypothetical protein